MADTLRVAIKEELGQLQQIFEDNYIGKGGLLVNRDFCPDEENLIDILVYEIEGNLIGYVNKNHVLNRVPTKWYAKYNDDNFIFINQIAIKATEQRKGHGSKIYNRISEMHPVVYAYVNADNKLSADFHIKFGFEVVGKWEKDNYKGVDNYKAYLYRYESMGSAM